MSILEKFYFFIPLITVTWKHDIFVIWGREGKLPSSWLLASATTIVFCWLMCGANLVLYRQYNPVVWDEGKGWCICWKHYLLPFKNGSETQSLSDIQWIWKHLWFTSTPISDKCVLTLWTLLFPWQKRNQQDDDWGIKKHYNELQTRNEAKVIFSVTIKLSI